VISRILPLGAILAGLFMLAPAAQAAQNFGSCKLDGTAKFSTGLLANQPTPDPSGPGINWGSGFSYSFGGTLTNCVKLDGGGPGQVADATISAGEKIAINGVQYLPANTPSGNGGCTGSHTDGISLIKWGDGKLSAVHYTTDGAAAAVGLTGNFLDKITLTRVDKGPNGETLTDTFSNLAFAGDYTGGPLTFQPPDPTLCNSTGVVEAAISGAIGHGNYQ